MLVVTALLNGKRTGSCLKVHTVRQKDAITSFFVGSEIQSFRNYVLPLLTILLNLMELKLFWQPYIKFSWRMKQDKHFVHLVVLLCTTDAMVKIAQYLFSNIKRDMGEYVSGRILVISSFHCKPLTQCELDLRLCRSRVQVLLQEIV